MTPLSSFPLLPFYLRWTQAATVNKLPDPDICLDLRPPCCNVNVYAVRGMQQGSWLHSYLRYPIITDCQAGVSCTVKPLLVLRKESGCNEFTSLIILSASLCTFFSTIIIFYCYKNFKALSSGIVLPLYWSHTPCNILSYYNQKLRARFW